MIGSMIDAFAHGLGLSEFSWSVRQGVAVFAFDRRGTLYLEEHPEGLLMYLSRDLDLRERGRARLTQALRLCHHRHDWPFLIQVGLRDVSHLVFLARLPLSEVTLPALEQALELLTRLHDQTASAV
ncbi:CesT family type III secretion system chaperone [uncultured Thiocystis sp.]|jgi:type III secretion system chaperone SycN|uniref:CesT family type III secretion system chaperone n=1 Tax=uncultured Thiocystis sp. TaxID=1202134 RepID=UPI0025ED7960|nr:CesT family type III secretion system chaperone [uncultured Thiocystis sp.]